MKCIAKTSRWGVKPCPNNAKCDGYCYAHHPSVVLAKLWLYQRAGQSEVRDYMRIHPGLTVDSQIKEQELLLEKINVDIGDAK